ncbi:hypothetical protein VPH35_063949 [Triticum aestivum]
MATGGHSYPPPLETYTPRVFCCESGVAGCGGRRRQLAGAGGASSLRLQCCNRRDAGNQLRGEVPGAATIYVDGCNQWLPMLQPRPRHCGDTHTGDATTARRGATTGKFFCWIRLRFLLESTNFLLQQITGLFVTEICFAGIDVNFCCNRLRFFMESANFLLQHIT